MSNSDYTAHQAASLEHAIRFATQKHAGDVRKGTTRPYILHPLEVMHILDTMDADPELLMAGVLHDTLEDTNTTREEIAEHFGESVAALVASHSEDKSKTWRERKQRTIDELAGASREHLLLVLADKISNLRSMSGDYDIVGEALWTRFHEPRAGQAWYHEGIRDALSSLARDPKACDAYRELVDLCQKLFH